ncbi:hypothetical protein C8R46DRAFT_599079 [Mycena filopes]|nr:hypothetical protein C8R46DRAFT_599079 [Mycena filopes]
MNSRRRSCRSDVTAVCDRLSLGFHDFRPSPQRSSSKHALLRDQRPNINPRVHQPETSRAFDVSALGLVTGLASDARGLRASSGYLIVVLLSTPKSSSPRRLHLSTDDAADTGSDLSWLILFLPVLRLIYPCSCWMSGFLPPRLTMIVRNAQALPGQWFEPLLCFCCTPRTLTLSDDGRRSLDLAPSVFIPVGVAECDVGCAMGRLVLS